jgi:hypothetical protein
MVPMGAILDPALTRAKSRACWGSRAVRIQRERLSRAVSTVPWVFVYENEGRPNGSLSLATVEGAEEGKAACSLGASVIFCRLCDVDSTRRDEFHIEGRQVRTVVRAGAATSASNSAERGGQEVVEGRRKASVIVSC